MIQANELRIGNWVNHVNEYPAQIRAYDFEHSNFHKINPIPLTPEVLEKCGFVGVKSRVNDSIHKYRKGGIEIFLPEYGFCYYDGDCWTIVKSLHQLQNLYFALTGEELEYKP